MDYPVLLEAYLDTQTDSFLEGSQIVRDEFEANSFRSRYPKCRIVITNIPKAKKHIAIRVWNYLSTHKTIPFWSLVLMLVLFLIPYFICNNKKENDTSEQYSPPALIKKDTTIVADTSRRIYLDSSTLNR